MEHLIVFLVSGKASATMPDGSSCPERRLWVETTRTAQFAISRQAVQVAMMLRSGIAFG